MNRGKGSVVPTSQWIARRPCGEMVLMASSAPGTRTVRTANVVALGLALGLLVFALLVPAASHAPVLAAFILVPVVLFGLVTVPQTLWPANNLEPLVPLPAPARATLFQRPPPQSLQ
jgi:hypothetical protein